MFYDIYLSLCNKIRKKPSAVAAELGINKSNVSNWKSSGYTPRGETLQKIADYFHVSTDVLLSSERLSNVSLQPDTPDETVHKTISQIEENAKVLGVDPYSIMNFDTASIAMFMDTDAPSSSEMEMIIKYRSLDRYGQKAVNELLETEYQRSVDELQESMNEQEPAPEIIYFSIPEYESPMSAGAGEEAGQEYPDNLRLIKEPPPGASYVARVKGDSMEPSFYDGDRLFIQACYEINVGEVGVFYMDGQQWVKELGDGELISHNEAYEPRPMTEDIRCQGRVLGVCGKEYLE